MAAVRRSRRHKQAKDAARSALLSPARIALGIFCLLVIVGPLAFGAVDRITQIALLAIFAAGLWVRPAVMLPLSRWENRLVIALLTIFVLKEFAPAAWFGAAHWRTVLVENFNLELPWTHNPEPARALDGMLAAGAAALWFIWVRTLASDRASRRLLLDAQHRSAGDLRPALHARLDRIRTVPEPQSHRRFPRHGLRPFVWLHRLGRRAQGMVGPRRRPDSRLPHFLRLARHTIARRPGLRRFRDAAFRRARFLESAQ
jgi:hypothetical protein